MSENVSPTPTRLRIRSLPLSAFLVAGLLFTLFGLATPALAHEAGTTAIELTVGHGEVSAQIDLPVDRLELALGTDLATDPLALSLGREVIAGYVADHLAFTDTAFVGQDSIAWNEEVGTLTAITVDGNAYLRLDIAADAGGPVPSTFTMSYDAILEHDATHQVIVTAIGESGAANIVGIFDSATAELAVTNGGVGSDPAFTVMIRQGFEHVLDGADHLLFLLALLVLAPLVVSAGRWRQATGPEQGARHALRKVLHVVTAFTFGHSLTLIASSLGWISLPSGPVEVVVGVSVAVAALYAIRPIAVRGEIGIAAAFGLIHGLAFSGILDDLGLASSTSLLSLFGFNLGIEAAQLAVVALTFPSLWLLSRTRIYGPVRVVGASIALVASTGWVVERLGITANPFAAVETMAIEHLGLMAAALAATAALASAAGAITERLGGWKLLRNGDGDAARAADLARRPNDRAGRGQRVLRNVP